MYFNATLSILDCVDPMKWNNDHLCDCKVHHLGASHSRITLLFASLNIWWLWTMQWKQRRWTPFGFSNEKCWYAKWDFCNVALKAWKPVIFLNFTYGAFPTVPSIIALACRAKTAMAFVGNFKSANHRSYHLFSFPFRVREFRGAARLNFFW